MTSIRHITAVLTACIAPTLFVLPEAAAAAEAQANPQADGRRDFDFCHGVWSIQNRRLLKPLSGADEWETFTATNTCWPILDGMGNQDEFRTPHRPGAVGMSLRFFNTKTKLWSIYWIDNRMGTLEPPVVGKFVAGNGIFEGPDVFDGKPITVRYSWLNTLTPTPRWEQAFSLDGGKTWQTNWVMDFTRVASKAEAAK